MANQQTYPTGVRPLLLEEAARRRRVETQFVDALEAARFAEVVLPIIDYADAYSGLVDRAAARQSYRFVDREGDLVAIRSDFTPMVARALAPALESALLPLRLFYRGDVIRCEASRLGTNRELFQIGAEIVGDGSVEADVDVLRLAAAIARSFGIEPLVVYNDVAVADSLGAEAREALVTKRPPQFAPPLVAKLVDGSATLDDVRGYAPAADAAARLASIGAGLRNDAAFALHLDDIDASSGYYTGLRFRLYAARSRRLLAQGGRYDSLYGRFGAPAPAVGFTFTLDELITELD